VVPLAPAKGVVALFVLPKLLFLLRLLAVVGSFEEHVATVEPAKPEPDFDAFHMVVERPADWNYRLPAAFPGTSLLLLLLRQLQQLSGRKAAVHQ
jgi:hypothetical protein